LLFFLYREIPIEENTLCRIYHKNNSKFLSIVFPGRTFLFVGISRQTKILLCALGASVVILDS